MDSEKALLADIAFALVGYEEGDLMALAGLADRARALVEVVGSDPAAGPVATGLRLLVDQTLDGTLDDLPRDRIAAGVDLLERWAEARAQAQKPADTLVEALADWTHQKAAGPTAPPPSEPLTLFLGEAHERLSDSQGLILDLEADPANRAVIDMLFRTFHTIKGECGFLKVTTLGELAHNIENLLDLLRNQELTNDEEVIELLFRGIDLAQDLLGALERSDDPTRVAPDLPGYLADLRAKTSMGKKRIGDLLQDSGKLTAQNVTTILDKQKATGFAKKFGEIAQEEALVTASEVADLVDRQRAEAEPAAAVQGPLDPLIKVKASQVNYLVDMIGELLIIENQLDEHDKHAAALRKITRTIQTAAMQLRTVKVKGLFINLKRIARDAAKQLGKAVTVVTQGDDLEIDRNLVERLEEPMMHMVRNCVGHGIEPVDVRRSRGKPEVGTIILSALRQGNNIVIGVHDDGGGLAVERILTKAIDRGLVPEARRQTITRNEVLNLIFLPGFSTAETVDAISGRGVGMDIVKTAVTAARGKIETRSEEGQSTDFSLVFPLSLAIIDGMIVVSRRTHYIIPIAHIVETLKVEPGQLQSVEGRTQVLNLRGEILPVVSLAEYFSQGRDHDPALFVIVVESEEKKFALLVDGIVAKKEVVIKSLGKKFRQLPAISSAAVLPGGSIGFVINVEDVVRT